MQQILQWSRWNNWIKVIGAIRFALNLFYATDFV